MPKEVVLELRNVYKKYIVEKVDALKDINLKIHESDFIAIMGPSGSGKSTLMNLIGLLDVPTSGKIFLDKKDVSKLDEDKLADLRGKKLGFIFQMFNLVPTLTALENVMLPVIFQGKNSEMEGRALMLLEKMGMKDRSNHLPRQLSGGEQQRVAIARSLINNPELILADEPTGNLDSKTGKTIMEILNELHEKEGKTFVVITHDPRIAEYAHEIVNIIDGQIVHDHKMSKSFAWKGKSS